MDLSFGALMFGVVFGAVLLGIGIFIGYQVGKSQGGGL
jgi:hypothetical protein